MDCGLQTEDCGLRTADCGLRAANCELRTADCGLRTADCRLPTGGYCQKANPSWNIQQEGPQQEEPHSLLELEGIVVLRVGHYDTKALTDLK